MTRDTAGRTTAPRSTTGGTRARPRILLGATDPFSSVFFRGQVAALVAAGADVTLVTSPGEWPRTLAADEGAVYLPVSMARDIAPVADVKALLSLVGVLRRVRPDLVIAGSPKASLLLMAAAAAAHVPARVFSIWGLRSATLHGVRRAVVLACERASARLATDVVCVSHSLRDEAIAAGIVKADRAHVVGSGSANGVDLDRFVLGSGQLEGARRLRAGLGCTDEDLLVGFVGRLTREKGVCELAQAWSQLRKPGARLVLVGPDESEPECRAALRTLADDPTVRFTGTIADMPPMYAAMDLLVLPTWREGLANALIEAAAMSVPVVATRVTGCVNAVADGETGTLVAPRDVEALVQRMREYLERPDMRAAHGAAGRRRVEQLFDSRRVWRGQIDHYNRILSRNGRPLLRPQDDPRQVTADETMIGTSRRRLGGAR